MRITKYKQTLYELEHSFLQQEKTQVSIFLFYNKGQLKVNYTWCKIVLLYTGKTLFIDEKEYPPIL